jgi:hypothetical protein
MKMHHIVKIAGGYLVVAFLWNRYGAGNISSSSPLGGIPALPLDLIGMVLPARQAGGI